MIKLVLASQSPSRRAILTRLCIQHEAISPDIIEEPGLAETPQQYVQRLSFEKAQKVCRDLPPELLERYEDIWILGNDQTGVCKGKIYEKPETTEVALLFFRDFSESVVVYYSGITLLSMRTGRFQTGIHESSVLFNKLTDEMVLKYLECCPSALQCASGLKIEGPGVILVNSVHITDPYAGPGLPIFILEHFCKNWGHSLLDFCTAKSSFLAHE